MRLNTPLFPFAVATATLGCGLDAAPLPATAAAATAAVEGDAAPSSRAVLGGYGELHLSFGDNVRSAALDRIVLFAGGDVGNGLRVETETEVEDGHEVEIEQAYLEWQAAERVQAQGGLVLLPISRLNASHEPPTYLTVERPGVDTAVLPSTWREVGARIAWRAADAWSFDAALVNGLDAHGFRAEDGFRGGRQNGTGVEVEEIITTSEARATSESEEEAAGVQFRDLGAALRAAWTPLLGTSVAISGYTSKAGQGDVRLADVRASLLSGDIDVQRAGWSVRATAGAGFLRDAEAVRTVTLEDVGSRFHGEALEVGYDILRGRRSTAAARLIPYVRWEHLDPRSAVPAGTPALPSLATTTWTAGVSFLPSRQVALKGAVMRTHDTASDTDETTAALGLGWMF